MRRLAAACALLIACGCAMSATVPRLAHGSIRAPSHAAGPKLGIKHVFLIVLENESYADSYLHNPNHYLGRTLQRQGTLLTQYHAIGHVSLDNYIAMISGQAPNADTSSDCQKYMNFNDSTLAAKLDANGQAIGAGCIYPANVKTLADQLTANHISWHGYMNEMGTTPSREQRRCGQPTINSLGLDDTQTATAKDQYAARHNPFVYFHSLLDSGRCKQNVVPLAGLRTALTHVRTTPDFNFITPDLCNDGHDSPCVGKDSMGSQAGGLTSVDHFLRVWIPRIEHSPAFRKSGLIIITSDESATSDTSSCCHEQPGPTDPHPGISGPGGGRIGTLVIGRCVRRGAKDPTPYNHYSLLRSLENLYGIRHGGTDHNGHLGYAAAPGLRPFGTDLFARCPSL
jgi:hypothetical protein